MEPRCTCQTGGGYPHHHAFGGTYPCETPEPCRGCRDPEFREPTVLPVTD